MRGLSTRQTSRIQRHIGQVLVEQVQFIVRTQENLVTWDGVPHDIDDEESVTEVSHWVPCRIQHGTDGMVMRSYRDMAQVGDVGDVWVQIESKDAWIAQACRDSEGGRMVIDGRPASIIEITPNRVMHPTSHLVKGRYRSDV